MSQDKEHLAMLGPVQKKLVIDSALLDRAAFTIEYCLGLMDDEKYEHVIYELTKMLDGINAERLPWAAGRDNPFVISARLNEEKESA